MGDEGAGGALSPEASAAPTDERFGAASERTVELIPPKMSRPYMRQSRVRRQRLIDLLDAGARRSVTLVCAGAGWGKTTVVSAWAAAPRYPVAWLTLDRYDNDPEVFWAHVIAALRTSGAVPPDNPLAGLATVPEDGRLRMHYLARGLSRLRVPTAMVLDDFDEITDARLIRELGNLVRFRHEAFRIVLISRSEPALPLHRLRAQDELSEIRTGDLAFTAEEAVELFTDQQLHLSSDDVATLLERTEGWAVGLHLAMAFIAVADGPRSIADFAGDVRPVDDYLGEELLARQTPRLRRFLLYTSICDHLCGELADAITMETAGQRTLEELEQVNQFVVRLGSRPRWFRYHRLARDVLRHRLVRETPAALPELHLRAAGWYARHSLILEALEHAVAAQDWPYVGRLVVEAAPMILSRHRGALVTVLGQVPAEELSSTAELVVCAATQLFYAGDFDAIPRRLAEAWNLLTGRPETERQPTEVAILALQAAVSRAHGDMPELVDQTTRLLTTLGRTPLIQLPSMLQYRAIALNNKGVGLLWTGSTEAAARYLGVAATAARAAGIELVEVNAIGHLALLEVISGSVREAERLARHAGDLAERRGLQHALQVVPTYLASALVELQRHHLESAELASQRGLRVHRSEPEAAQWTLWLGVQARLMLAQDNLTSARALLEEAHSERYPHARMPALQRWLLVVESEADLMADRPELVQRRYRRLGRRELSFPERILLARAAFAVRDLRGVDALLARPGSLMAETVATVEAGILTALVADAEGHGLSAADALAKAIALAAQEGIRQPFLRTSGGRLEALLGRQSMLAGNHARFVADLMQMMGAAGNKPAPHHPAGELSDRETEVLQYLPTMLTAAEIAEELGVSVNTVKAHMRAIYRKLGAERRRQAVVRARELGFV